MSLLLVIFKVAHHLIFPAPPLTPFINTPALTSWSTQPRCVLYFMYPPSTTYSYVLKQVLMDGDIFRLGK